MSQWYNDYAWLIFPAWLLASAYCVLVAVVLSDRSGPRSMRLAGFIVACYCLLRTLTCLLRAMKQYELARDVGDATTLWSMLGAIGVAIYIHRWRPGRRGW